MSVRGNLSDMNLVDLVNIFHLDRKTAAIHLSSERGYGRLHFRNGEIIHASCGTLYGPEAVYHLLTWSDGDFEMETSTTIPAITINMNTNALLLEGLRRLDESKKHSVRAPSYKGDIASLKLFEELIELGILEKARGTADGR